MEKILIFILLLHFLEIFLYQRCKPNSQITKEYCIIQSFNYQPIISFVIFIKNTILFLFLLFFMDEFNILFFLLSFLEILDLKKYLYLPKNISFSELVDFKIWKNKDNFIPEEELLTILFKKQTPILLYIKELLVFSYIIILFLSIP